MSLDPARIQQAIAEATASLARGSVARADLVCQSVLAQGVRPLEIVLVEGRIAASIGEFAAARRYFAEANATEALIALQKLESGSATVSAVSRQRFHLIQSWGCGFTSDVDHTLGHLLLAEMTGRTPVIHWGKNSLFRDEGVENAWLEYFLPVSAVTPKDLTSVDFTYFPPKWNAANLFNDVPSSRAAGIYYLNQKVDVTVGDFFTGVIELLPWVRSPHPLASNGPMTAPVIESAYRYLIDRYLKPRPEIVAEVDAFAARHFAGRKMLAVHVRGSDKSGETANLADGHRRIFEAVKSDLQTQPDLFVFLLTDEQPIRDLHVNQFPGRIITTDCQRSPGVKGVHYLPVPSRRQLGVEVLRDAYLAARCDRFLALGCTNVSNFILHLKPWPTGSARLLGPVSHYQRNFVLHR